MNAVLVGFALGFVGSMPITGPVGLLVFERGMSNRRREALRIAIGAAVIEAAYAALAYWGIGALLQRHPAIAPISRLITAAVLVAIGSIFILRKPSPVEQAAPDAPSPRGNHSHSLLGASLILINPTIIATWTVITTALHAERFAATTLLGALAFGSGVGAGIVTWFMTLLRLLHSLRQRLTPSTLHRIRLTAGSLILILGLIMAARMIAAALGS